LAKKVTAHAAAQRDSPVETAEAKIRLPEPLAIRRVTSPARSAAPRGFVGQHHMVAELDSHHRVANSFHYAGAFMTKHEEREHMEIAKRSTARQWETIKMLLGRGLKFPEACEIAKNCDAEPAWL
jgi:hypothetical protein